MLRIRSAPLHETGFEGVEQDGLLAEREGRSRDFLEVRGEPFDRLGTAGQDRRVRRARCGGDRVALLQRRSELGDERGAQLVHEAAQQGGLLDRSAQHAHPMREPQQIADQLEHPGRRRQRDRRRRRRCDGQRLRRRAGFWNRTLEIVDLCQQARRGTAALGDEADEHLQRVLPRLRQIEFAARFSELLRNRAARPLCKLALNSRDQRPGFLHAGGSIGIGDREREPLSLLRRSRTGGQCGRRSRGHELDRQRKSLAGFDLHRSCRGAAR